MVINVLTIFPKMFEPIVNESIIKRAQQKGLIKINLYDLRDFTKDRHKKVDDRPFGGGPGMVFNPQPIFDAVEFIKSKISATKIGGSASGGKKPNIILLSPQGKTLNHKNAKRISKYKHNILICGHYEGIDERVRQYLIDEEISIGDYVLTGGELPAMVLIDCIVRLVPNVLGAKDSLTKESFSDSLLEYPQYTRPADFRGMKVPKVLLSGDHKRIEEWRRKKALIITKKIRPDILRKNK